MKRVMLLTLNTFRVNKKQSKIFFRTNNLYHSVKISKDDFAQGKIYSFSKLTL